MKSKLRYWVTGLSLIVAVVVVWATVGYFGSAKAPTTKPDDSQAVAPVTTAVIKSGEVSQTITAYGNVTAQPGAVVVLSAPVECRVKHLRVAGGQTIDTDATVIEIEPSPDARLQLIDAKNALEGAKKDSASAHQRLELKLVTNAEAQIADQSVQTAQIKFDDLIARGAGDKDKAIRADAPAVVARVDVQEGQLVPAGAALVELVPRGQIEVRLGVEPIDAVLLSAGQPVQLFPSTADEDEPVDGKIRLVTRRVNPDSRLIDVFIAPSETDALLLDGSVRGELALKTVSGLVVPHDALLPDDAGFSIFTVVDTQAIKHAVKVAVQNDIEAVVTGDGLHEGDVVIVGGNLELDDKSVVKATPANTASGDAEGGK